ncbi:hypothetical protein GCM10017710_06620 [Arthrobacter ramosus]
MLASVFLELVEVHGHGSLGLVRVRLELRGSLPRFLDQAAQTGKLRGTWKPIAPRINLLVSGAGMPLQQLGDIIDRSCRMDRILHRTPKTGRSTVQASLVGSRGFAYGATASKGRPVEFAAAGRRLGSGTQPPARTHDLGTARHPRDPLAARDLDHVHARDHLDAFTHDAGVRVFDGPFGAKG